MLPDDEAMTTENEMLSLMSESGNTLQRRGPLKSKLPFDPEGTEYDYRTAKAHGITPDETGHWPSRAPDGQILKGANHPTFYKTMEGERAAGYEVTKNSEDGRYYSHPDPHFGARQQAVSRLANYPIEDYAAPTSTFDRVMTETPGLAPLYKGVSTADAGIMSVAENVPGFLHGLSYDMRNQFLTPGEFPALREVGQTFSEDMEKWEDRLQTDRYDYESTPGNQLIRGTGEFLAPIAGSTARVTHGMLRSPLNRLGPSVDEVKRTVSPEFSQGRRNFGKGAAITGAALGTGVGVAKLAKHADEIIHGTKAGKAAGKAIAGDKWDTAVQAIYDADRTVGMRGV